LIERAALRPIAFRGDSLDRLREFPQAARRETGFQLDRVQRGLEPYDWKPMASVGAGCKEIRVRDAAGAFRAVYVAHMATTVYVLHCFQKKSGKTGRADLKLARARYKELMRIVK
jgi:phage-related protein